MSVEEAVIVDGIRTPFGKRDGSFRDLHPEILGALPLQALIERYALRPEEIDDVILGNVTSVGEQGQNIARKVALALGLGEGIAGVTINRMCGSGQQAVAFACQAIRSGEARLVLAGGVEHMTRVPILSDAGPVSKELSERYEILHQGESAERIADRWGFTREDLDRFAFESQRKYREAEWGGKFKEEILPVRVRIEKEERIVEKDEHPRADTTLEKLSTLKPAFRPHGRLTAGNSSGIVDGAAALLVTSARVAQERGWRPLARITATSVVGSDPVLMLTGPIPATRRVLERTHLSIEEIDLFECNEAFASVPLAWMKETKAPPEKVNVLGGAIAHGHPLGATGAMLLLKLIRELHRRGKRWGLSTMCIGFGQGIASVVERL